MRRLLIMALCAVSVWPAAAFPSSAPPTGPTGLPEEIRIPSMSGTFVLSFATNSGSIGSIPPTDDCRAVDVYAYGGVEVLKTCWLSDASRSRKGRFNATTTQRPCFSPTWYADFSSSDLHYLAADAVDQTPDTDFRIVSGRIQRFGVFEISLTGYATDQSSGWTYRADFSLSGDADTEFTGTCPVFGPAVLGEIIGTFTVAGTASVTQVS